MRRLAIIDLDMSLHGGIEWVSTSIANALAGRYEIELISIYMVGDGPAFPLDERIRHTVLLPAPDRLRYMRKEIKKKLPGWLKDKKIDTVLIQGNYPGWLISSTCAKAGVRLIFSDHEGFMNRPGRRDLIFMRWYTSGKCDRTVVLTEYSRNGYINTFRLPKEKIRCIYNWIEPDIAVSKEYDESSKRIISAGRLSREKGFDLLIRAFAPAAKKHPDWYLDIYGDGDEREKIEGMIKEFGIEDNVRLCGTVDRIWNYYGQYAMYVLPSYVEGMPMVLLEAKANKLPIISFDIRTGPKEIVTDGVNGLLIPPYDTDQMAEAINRLIEDADLRKSMSDHASDDLMKFSKDRIVQQWIELIEEKEET